MDRLHMDVLILVVVLGFWATVRAVNRVYQRLDRLPLRILAKTVDGDEIYRKD